MGVSRRPARLALPPRRGGWVYTENAMARDYYPLLARAVASLEQNTADARQVVYDHARGVLRELVRDQKPALPPSERTDEMLALEDAIRKVELKVTSPHQTPAEPAAKPSNSR
jgi:hypothetical protein